MCGQSPGHVVQSTNWRVARVWLVVAIAGYLLASPLGLVLGTSVFYITKALSAVLVLPGLYLAIKRGISKSEFLLGLSVLYAASLAPVALTLDAPPFYVVSDIMGLAVLVAAALIGRHLLLEEARRALNWILTFGVAGWALWLLLVTSGVVVAKLPAFDPVTTGIVFGYVVYQGGWRRICALAALPVVFWANVQLVSRTGAVAFGLFSLLSVLILIGRKSPAFAAVIVIVVVLIGTASWWFDEAAAVIGGTAVWQMTFLDTGLDESTEARFLEFSAQVASIKDVGGLAYFSGLGPGAVFEFEGDFVHHAHVSPVFLWFKFGLIGLLLYFWFTWFVVARLVLALFSKASCSAYGDKERAGKASLGLIFYAAVGASIMVLPGQLVLWNPVLGLLAGVAHGHRLGWAGEKNNRPVPPCYPH